MSRAGRSEGERCVVTTAARGTGDAISMKPFVADTPLRRFGEASEVAALAVLLASDEAAYMTGSELTIDGGILAGSAASPG